MNCASCGAKLELVSKIVPMRRQDDWTIQYRRALAITIDGGYGMFFDVLHSSHRERTAILCHDCAHAFVRANPWAMDLLKVEIIGFDEHVTDGRQPDEFGHMHEPYVQGLHGHD